MLPLNEVSFSDWKWSNLCTIVDWRDKKLVSFCKLISPVNLVMGDFWLGVIKFIWL